MGDGASSYHRFLEGDNDGLRSIIDEYYDGLTLYLNTFLRNMSLAEEMSENTLVDLVTKKPAFHGRSDFKTWLYSIGRNITIDYIRRESKKKTDSLEEYADLAADDLTVEQEYIQDEEKRMIHRCMAALNDNYRQILWLYYFENMSQKDISCVMKKSIHSVEHLLCRARNALKSQLEKEGYQYEKS